MALLLTSRWKDPYGKDFRATSSCWEWPPVYSQSENRNLVLQAQELNYGKHLNELGREARASCKNAAPTDTLIFVMWGLE